MRSNTDIILAKAMSPDILWDKDDTGVPRLKREKLNAIEWAKEVNDRLEDFGYFVTVMV